MKDPSWLRAPEALHGVGNTRTPQVEIPQAKDRYSGNRSHPHLCRSPVDSQDFFLIVGDHIVHADVHMQGQGDAQSQIDRKAELGRS